MESKSSIIDPTAFFYWNHLRQRGHWEGVHMVILRAVWVFAFQKQIKTPSVFVIAELNKIDNGLCKSRPCFELKRQGK